MKRQLFSLAITAAIFMAVLPACSKDDDPAPAANKTELLVKSSWKFEKAEAGIIGDVSSMIDDCIKDNQLTFVTGAGSTTAGTGTADEGSTKCDPSDPQTSTFDWTFMSNETILRSNFVLFPGASTDYTIVSLTATNLVLSQQVVLDPSFPATTVTVTLKH